MSQIAVQTEGSRFPHRRLARKQGAEERAQISSAQTPQERLAVLDQRLGVGVGAVRERARLAQVMARPTVFDVPITIHGEDVLEEPDEPRQKKQKRRRREDKRGS